MSKEDTLGGTGLPASKDALALVPYDKNQKTVENMSDLSTTTPKDASLPTTPRVASPSTPLVVDSPLGIYQTTCAVAKCGRLVMRNPSRLGGRVFMECVFF